MPGSKYKPLSFSTTLRNPNRIAAFLKCLQDVENQILTNDVAIAVAKNLIRNRFYWTRYEKNTPEYLEIYQNEDETFTEEQLDDIIENTVQDHKEAGFDAGWPSRFDTWYKLPMEFGYCYYAMNQSIQISPLGHMLIDAISEEEVNEEQIQNVLLHSMMKYQTNNPFRKNLNDNVPLILLLQVIRMLHEHDEESAGVFRQELSFFICWPNSDANSLYNEIISFRQQHHFGEYTDEIIYDKCLEILHADASDRNYYKMEKITGEAVDEYIRKMRSTGIISLRGNGRFIDFNTLEINKINYVLEHYSTYPQFEAKEDYYTYMGTADEEILQLQRTVEAEVEDDIRKQALLKYATQYDPETIFTELQKVCNRRESTDPMLRVIAAPARFEFLISVALVQHFEGLDVCPNYHTDDEGLPTSTASGGIADIVCTYNDTVVSLVEVTLMMGRQQVNNEMLPISRHLSEIKNENPEAFSIFVAPGVHDDAIRFARFIYHDEQLLIKTYGINEFMNEINNFNTIRELATPGWQRGIKNPA